MIHLIRPLRCTGWCCFCCLQEMEVQAPPGTTVGYIKQDCSFIYPWYTIQNADREDILKIKGPCWTCKWCDVEFTVCNVWFWFVMGKVLALWTPKKCFCASNFYDLLPGSNGFLRGFAVLLFFVCLFVFYLFIFYFFPPLMNKVSIFFLLSSQVLSADGTQEVGKITKQWSGLAKEWFTDADNFGIQCKNERAERLFNNL